MHFWTRRPLDRRAFILAAASACVPFKGAAAPAWPGVPSNDAIRAILKQRIDVERRGVGMVVGVVEPTGRRIVAYGQRAYGKPAPVTADSVFEIGSITKVFTALILMQMVQEGRVRLDQPIAELFPPGTKLPERGGRKITLIDLATHTSGLSSDDPPDLPDPDTFDGYTTPMMMRFLATYELPRDIGSAFEYSNVGLSLLGAGLMRVAGAATYEALVRPRVLDVLGMKDTTVNVGPRPPANLALPHLQTRKPTKNWTLDAIAPAGALCSTAPDLLTFLAAQIGLEPSPLSSAMRAQLSVQRAKPAPHRWAAIGWHIDDKPGGRAIWHDGGTGGYRTFAGFNPATRCGVVVLSNLADEDIGMQDIGYHLLCGEPLLHQPNLRAE